MDELIDLVSFADRPLAIIEKGQAHREGLLHRAVHLWIVHAPDGEKPALLLQLRGRDKSLMPNRYDVSAAGHLLAGESYLCGALRECGEELGFTPDAHALCPLGKRVELFEDATLKNFELCTCYLLRDDRMLADYPIGYPEVAGLCLAPLQDLAQMLSGACETTKVTGLFYDENGVMVRETREITCADFVPRVDAYMEKITDLATRFLAGEQGLYV